MVKTMRITGVLSVLLTAGLLVFPAILALGNDKQTDDILGSQSIVEKFKKARNTHLKGAEEEDSPLVKEAQKFALYLNPPAPKPPRSAGAGGVPMVRPPISVPKFKLIGTSIYSSDPKMSLALIDEPGKGLRWVRQSSKIERFVVEEVKNGIIVVSDGATKVELKAEREPRKSLLRNPGSESISQTGQSETLLSGVEQGAIEDTILQQQSAQNQDASDKTENQGVEEMTAEEVEKMFAELEAMSRVSEDEANTLSSMGEELKEQEAKEARERAKVEARRDIGLRRIQQIRASRTNQGK